jgi:predicted RNase H-like HicB family nuclease
MKNLKITITKEDVGYSAYGKFGEDSIHTEGDSFDELKANVVEALNLCFEDQSVTIDDVHFIFDIKSFFNFFNVINAKALSERVGINQSLLAQYISGVKKPSAKQTEKILKGIHDLGKELTEIELLVSH